MALKIRLQRHGTKGKPVYRLVVAEDSAPRDGKYVELLGHYNPQARGQDPEFKINVIRLNHWLGVGAKPTESAKTLIKKSKKQEADHKGEVISLVTAAA